MSKTIWTVDQQKVIDLRKRNILVSAAAGSGKTAVLVERIIQMITDHDCPIDIDHLIIVTFTNAAASEMKQRIGAAIEKKLVEEPENEHLQQQLVLLNTAQITTIHSFCLYIIRNYFNTIDLDPSFRVADETELVLIKSDVIKTVLEEKYEKLEKPFVELVEKYTPGKNDAGLEELILSLYRFSISYPWPELWLNNCKKNFDLQSEEDLNQAQFMPYLLKYVKAIINDIAMVMNEALDLSNGNGGPSLYLPVLEKEQRFVEGLLQLSTYQEFYLQLSNLSFDRLPGKKDPMVDPDVKERVKALRDNVKNSLKKLAESFFYQSPEAMAADILNTKVPMSELIDLTIAFMEEFKKRKEERGVVDFNDLEHFALNILTQYNEETQTYQRTVVAEELSEFYTEILIDEYQDSNLVQEIILNSISKETLGQPNVFMVGDVKQSIYKFRMAKPELFLEKYKSYLLEDSLYQKIDLHKNFRSRSVVLNPINYIFERVMLETLGDITYDEKAALHVGADYPEDLEGTSKDTELILIGEYSAMSNEQSVQFVESLHSDEEDLADYTEKELEAKAIAKRIKELMDPNHGLKLSVRGTNEFNEVAYSSRPVRYSDIVILLRSLSGWTEVMVDVLMSEGIMAYAQTQTGYFQTIEIRTVLNLLKIIDNPRQEIALAAVLHGPMYGFTSEELALIKIGRKNYELYQALLTYPESVDAIPSLVDKITHFQIKLNEYRHMATYLPIYELLQHVITDTNYYAYVKAMPAGERRAANIDMLIKRAIDFESTSYSGLFDFNRYVEKLNKYEIDFGEAQTNSEADNAVRIMSIHKSKGLEFPVVFVAGMAKGFNNQDANSPVVLHASLGIGPDSIDGTYRTKTPTLIKKAIARLIRLENLAEELRVLYVALTRAKEKLIMTGFIKKPEKCIQRIVNEGGQITYQELTSASSYMDWVLLCLREDRVFREVMQELGEGAWSDALISNQRNDAPFSYRLEDVLGLMTRETHIQVEKARFKQELLNWDVNQVWNEQIRDELIKTLNYRYPYAKEVKLKGKVSVSELKRIGQELDYEESEVLIPTIEVTKEQSEKDVPEKDVKDKDVKDKEQPEKEQPEKEQPATISGAELGSLYHRILQFIDLSALKSEDDIKVILDRMSETGQIEKEQLNAIDSGKIWTFISHPVGQRMKSAQLRKQLYREQPFVLGQPASSIHPSYQSEEMVLVQGIIDVFWEEEDGLVLLDYKTDKVFSIKELVRRYQIQLDYYKKALEQMTLKPVKEVYIYSITLGKAIRL